MKRINYKLIVSDLDGTLLNRSNAVPDNVRSAIGEYVANGGIFAVCTGRMLSSALPRVRELGLKGLVAAYQGTVIAEIESGKILKYGGMNAADASEICRTLEELGAYVNVYSDEHMFTSREKTDKYLNQYERITGIDAISVTDKKLSDFVTEKNLFCQKVTALVAPKERENIYRTLLARLGDRFDVTCSAEVLIEISPIEDNKGKALEYLAAHFNIPLSSTIAVGDNLNDLPMIKAAGLGVAVGNATKELKDAAKLVTVTNDEGAVAKLIKEFGFV